LAKDSSLSRLLEQNRVALTDLSRKSSAWFESHARDIARTNTNLRAENLMRGDQTMKTNRIVPGDMIMFIYDAKHKETLPYWDRFPLVFPYKTVTGGFYGLNLHYLPYVMRARLMDKLMVFSNDMRLTDNTRLKLKWELIGSFSQFAPAQVCVKHYLYSQVMTPFKKIHAQDWATALLLPVEQFQKQSKNAVWAQTKTTIRKM
jgi:hypothetical protein